MRVSREIMARHRQDIVGAAAVMLRERGIDGLSVADLMQSVGLTHGGFYRHFPSKEALVAEATRAAFDEIIARLAAATTKSGAAAALRAYVGAYLSLDHVEQPRIGCPIAAYGADIARTGTAVRDAYSDGLERLTSALALSFEGTPAQTRRLAQAILATMVGAVVTCRAAGDEKLTKSTLAAARSAVDDLIAGATVRRGAP